MEHSCFTSIIVSLNTIHCYQFIDSMCKVCSSDLHSNPSACTAPSYDNPRETRLREQPPLQLRSTRLVIITPIFRSITGRRTMPVSFLSSVRAGHKRTLNITLLLLRSWKTWDSVILSKGRARFCLCTVVSIASSLSRISHWLLAFKPGGSFTVVSPSSWFDIRAKDSTSESSFSIWRHCQHPYRMCRAELVNLQFLTRNSVSVLHR